MLLIIAIESGRRRAKHFGVLEAQRAVEALQIGVGEVQVLRASLGEDRKSPGLSSPNSVGCALGGGDHRARGLARSWTEVANGTYGGGDVDEENRSLYKLCEYDCPGGGFPLRDG